VKVQHAQPERKMHARHGIALIDGNELTLRENPAVIFEFFERVGLLGGVNEPANLDDGFVVQGFNQADSIVGGKHDETRTTSALPMVGERGAESSSRKEMNHEQKRPNEMC
jgi:hypothetical protein